MKLRNKIIKLGAAVAIAAPVAAVISCGDSADTTTNKNAGSTNTLSITDQINQSKSIYAHKYDYAKLLDNDKSDYSIDGSGDGTLTLDMAALRKMADAFPNNSNQFNDDVWSEVTRKAIEAQIRNNHKTDGTSEEDIKKEIKTVSTSSAPLQIQTDSIYYPYFDSTTPDEDGNTEAIDPGFYHIRPESKTDILTSDSSTSWNRLSVGKPSTAGKADFKQKIIDLMDTTKNKNLKDGDQLIINKNNTAKPSGALSSIAYTYYSEFKGTDGTTGPIDKPGFFMAQPLDKTGKGTLTSEMYGYTFNYDAKPDENRLDVENIQDVSNTTGPEGGVRADGTYSIQTFQVPGGMSMSTDLIPVVGFIFQDKRNQELDSHKQGFDGVFKWDPASPVVYRHILNSNEKKTIKLPDAATIDKELAISATDKTVLRYLQPDSRWISPSTGTGATHIDQDISELSYNGKVYNLTRSAERGTATLQSGYFYDPTDIKLLDTDSLHWEEAGREMIDREIPSTLQVLLVNTTKNKLEGFDGILKAYFGGHDYTMYAHYDDADKTPIPNILRGFYQTRPKNEDEARKLMFDMDHPNAADSDTDNNVADTDGKAIPFDINNVNKPVKLLVNNLTKKVKYWNPTNVGTLRIELLFDAASKFKTDAGFELTGMMARESLYSSNVLTQQDRGFSPEINSGSWAASLAMGSSGLERNLYRFADFIEVTGSTDFYYQHEYFNYDGTKELDLKALSNVEREKYRLPEILRGFYKNGTKLDINEYKGSKDTQDEKDDYITASLGTGSNHNKLIFNGLNGSKTLTTYKGVVYPSKSINGMKVHTSWSPKMKGNTIVEGEKQFSGADWTTSDGNTIAKPKDYFDLKQTNYGANIFSNLDIIKGFASQVSAIPFSELKTIKFVWGDDELATVDVKSLDEFKKLLLVIKSSGIFQGNISNVIKNLGLDGKKLITEQTQKDAAEKLFGADENAHKNSLMGKLSEQLKIFTELVKGTEATDA